MGTLGLNEQIAAESASKLTGGRVNYYLAQVDHPQREEQPAYQAECEDIISTLGMTFDEACEFKAIWRTAAARLGNGKPGRSQLDQAIYDAEKRVHYATRSLKALQHARDDAAVVDAAQDMLGQKPEKNLEVKTWWDWPGSQSGGGPAPSDLYVEIKRRDGNTAIGRVRSFNWSHLGTVVAAASDIVGWRHADQ
jgi:hypothetical protein